MWDKQTMALLLDPVQARAKFNYREQTKIYEKAERVSKRKVRKNQTSTGC